MTRWADLETTVNHLATTERQIRRLVHERRIPFHKLGGKLRFDLDEVDAFVKGTGITEDRPAKLRRVG